MPLGSLKNALLLAIALVSSGLAQFKPEISRAWDADALKAMTLPVSGLATPVQYPPAEWYYRIPERQIYRGYPVYDPRKEPPGYMDWLTHQNPELAFDPSTLTTRSAWTQAGEAVFSSVEVNSLLTPQDLHNPDVWEKFKFTADAEGSLSGWRYVIRKRGLIEVGPTLCGACHEGVVEGRMTSGAPGPSKLGALAAYSIRRTLNAARSREAAAAQIMAQQLALFSVPWRKPDPATPVVQLGPNELPAAYDDLPGGVVARMGTSLFFPPRIPDLIGIQTRTYFGATGLQRHLSIGDLMRYAALEAGMNAYLQYGDFRPSGELPDAAGLQRLSDSQLYALALYLYSLKPPPNPNRADSYSKRGGKIFEREGCPACHPAPLYTTAKPIEAASVGTDPRLTHQTRVSTGSYVVPPLAGVWYRGLLQHNGSLAMLEDWFDATRLQDNYVPTGFKTYAVKTQAVTGHAFGLKLTFDEKRALMAFLRRL